MIKLLDYIFFTDYFSNVNSNKLAVIIISTFETY